MNNFGEGDQLYMFGFSRGAYTVRAVASLLHMYGLIRPGNEPLVPYAIRMLTGINRANEARADQRNSKQRYFELAAEFKTTLSRTDCKPWFVVVLNTVNSVGWIENPLKLPHTANNPDIQIGRHAISIDERRAFFRTNLWHVPSVPGANHGPKDLKQVWFAGVHC